MRKTLERSLCWGQGVYYLLTGLWPIISVESFQQVTGRKTDHLVTGRDADHWLLNSVSALIVANAVVFLAAAWRGRISIDVRNLAVATAVALTSIDVIYVYRRAIFPIYLADAFVEIVLILGWLFLWSHMTE